MHLILTIHLFFYFLALIYTHLNLLEKDRKKQQHYFTRNFNSKITVTSSGIPKETILYAFGGSSYPLRLTKILLHSHFP